MRTLWILATVSWVGASCGSSSNSNCTVGASVACACTDGRTGAQVCQSDHTLAACVCSLGTGGSGGAGGAGTGAAGAGGRGGAGAGTAGAGGGGGAGAGTAGAGGRAGTAGRDAGTDQGQAPALMDGTFSGSAPNQVPDCQGLAGLTGCPVSITVTGTGPVYSVTAWDISVGITGNTGTITQTGAALAIDLLSDNANPFCGNAHFTGTATVGSGGASMMTVSLTGPVCGHSDTVGVMLDLTRQ